MTRITLAALLPLFLIAAPAVRSESPDRDLAKENAGLRAKVETLQKQNADLNASVSELRERMTALRREIADARDRLDQLERDRIAAALNDFKIIATPPTTQPKVPVQPKPNGMPPGTVERQFNGMSVYVVPLE